MWLQLHRALVAHRALGAGTSQQVAAVTGALRLFSSSTTPADEVNAEMAQFGIGGLGLQQQQQQQRQQQHQAAWHAQGSAAAVASSCAGRPSPEVLDEVQAVNSELFGFFGAPAAQQDASAEGSAGGLARQLAALAGQAVHAGSNVGMSSSSSSSSTSSSIISSRGLEGGSGAAGAEALSSSGGGSGGGNRNTDGSHLTHVDASGKAAMVDVSHKADTVRTATAGARVVLGPRVFDLVASNQLAKGDVLTVAQLAGVMGAKHTSTLIPLCHNILLSRVHVALSLEPEAAAVQITASATTVGPTGVEMEALTAAAVAALTVYDMCKAASKGVVVTDLRLLSKTGGKSGDWAAQGGTGGSAPGSGSGS